MKPNTREKQARKASISVGSDEEDFPRKRPRPSPVISSSALSEDEKNEKYTEDLMSIGDAIEELQSSERKFHLESQRRLEEFHQSQQDRYDGLKKRIRSLERRWSDERIRRIKQKKAVGPSDISGGPTSNISTPPISLKTSSPHKVKDSKDLGIARYLDITDTETEEEEDGVSHLAQPNGQREDKWTPASSTSVLHNSPSDGGYEDFGLNEIFTNARPLRDEEPRSTGLLNEDGFVEGMESLGAETQTGQKQSQAPPKTPSPSQDQGPTPPGGSPSYKATPRGGRSGRKDYKLQWPIDKPDDLAPLPATNEEDAEFVPSQITPPPKPAKKKRPIIRRGSNKIPRPSPEKSISKNESPTKKGDIGTPGGPKFGTEQKKLLQYFEKSPSKQLEGDHYRATPTPGGPPQADRTPRSSQISLDNQPEGQIKVRSALSPPILGGSSHLNKTPKKTTDRSHIQNFRAVRSPAS